MKTEDLIATLALEQVSPVKRRVHPLYQCLGWLLFVLLYISALVVVHGMRPDIHEKLAQPVFILELALILAVIAGALVSACLLSYPDAYGRFASRWLPFVPVALLAGVKAYEWLALPASPVYIAHYSPWLGQVDCTLCIVAFAAVPAYILFRAWRRGASTHQRWTGALTALAVSGVGCFALRLMEEGDNVVHIVTWHLLPVAVLAAIGAWVACYALRW